MVKYLSEGGNLCRIQGAGSIQHKQSISKSCVLSKCCKSKLMQGAHVSKDNIKLHAIQGDT